MQYQKVKSVSKSLRVKGPKLTEGVLSTMKTISDIVGATLGPGGQPVLIERQEFNLPAMVTKDGVTVFRALGFDDSVSQVIMETARDASIRTASEAGDGTTTATVLAEAIVRYAHEYVKLNPKISPQKVVQRLKAAFKNHVVDMFNPEVPKEGVKPGLARFADMSTDEGRALLYNVAKISANGDTELADAVLNCFDLVGDEGNVTITEISGPSGFEVERVEGYPIPMGYEDSCGKYGSKFLNDPANMRTVLEEPVFVVYHGRITEIQTIQLLMEKIGDLWQSEQGFRHNVVLVAVGFSESVLANLAVNFSEVTSINVVPLLCPMSNVPGGQLGLLEDICAVTGAALLDLLNKPIDRAEVVDLGIRAKTFEFNRFRSVIIADENDMDGALEIEAQVQKLQSQKKQSASTLDEDVFNERIGKLTGGIAKLKVVGSSSGELRERRDRAEDAICAVRGAIRRGCLPGGGWMLLKIADTLVKLQDDAVTSVLGRALLAPVQRILSNSGLNEEESKAIVERLCVDIVAEKSPLVYDAYNQKFVDAWEAGVLDSTPAVLEALRNSLSIATLLGTLGGAVVFKRDADLERHEAKETNSFLRDADYAANPADERGL